MMGLGSSSCGGGQCCQGHGHDHSPYQDLENPWGVAVLNAIRQEKLAEQPDNNMGAAGAKPEAKVGGGGNNCGDGCNHTHH